MPCNSSNVFCLQSGCLLYIYLPKRWGGISSRGGKAIRANHCFFCLCVFFLEPTNAKRSVIGRSASVPWSWSALRRPHQLRELSQTQPFNLGLLTFSLFCSLSSIVVPAERRFKERKKNYFGNNMAEEEVDIDLADPEVILHFSSLTY